MPLELRLTFPDSTHVWQGFAGLEQHTPSRFLSEIPPELLQNPPTVQRQRKKKAGKQLSLF